MVRQQRGEVAGQLGGQVQPADLGDFSRRPGAPHPRSREDGGLDLRGRLVGGIRQPAAQQIQPVRGQHDPDFFLELTRRCLGRSFAGLGFAAGVHELVRAPFPDGQEASGAIEDADGGDDDARVHSAMPASGAASGGASGDGSGAASGTGPGRFQPVQYGLQQLVLGGPGDVPAVAAFVRPEERVGHAVRVRIAPVHVLVGLPRKAHAVEGAAVREVHIQDIGRVRRLQQIFPARRPGERRAAQGCPGQGFPLHGAFFTPQQAAVVVGSEAYDAGEGSAGPGVAVQQCAVDGPGAAQVGAEVKVRTRVRGFVRGRNVQVPSIGIEPTTPALGEPCSIH